MRDQPIAHMRGIFVVAHKPGAQHLFLDRDDDAKEADQDESEYDAPPRAEQQRGANEVESGPKYIGWRTKA